MEDFYKYCADIRPNITYLAIGSAYSTDGGCQQFPPFLKKIISKNPEFKFSIQIILVDPLLEDPPEIVKHLDIRLIDKDWYGNKYLNIHAIRQNFSFDSIIENSDDNSFSKQFLLALIDRTIAANNENPRNTYLLFVHDFSGNCIDKLSDNIACTYKELGSVFNVFKKNVLIDLNNKINSGCFVDMESIYFHPQLIMNSLGALEIFNPFLLDDFEIFSISIQQYKNPTPKLLVVHAIMHRLNEFANNVLPYYRQIRMILERKTTGINLNLDDLKFHFLLQNININDIKMELNTSSAICGDIASEHCSGSRSSAICGDIASEPCSGARSTSWIPPDLISISSISNRRSSIISTLTKNMLEKLKSETEFLNFHKSKNIRHEIFGDFINICNKIYIDDHYQIIPTFRSCQKKLEIFIYNIDPTEHFIELNKYCIKHVIEYGKIPLFIELLLQDK